MIRIARLPAAARAMIEDEANTLWVSAVSIWESAIKSALGARVLDPINLTGTEAVWLFGATCYKLLPVTPAHAAAVDGPLRLHGDPFDRLLIAQARAEPWRLLTMTPSWKPTGRRSCASDTAGHMTMQKRYEVPVR